MPIQKIKSGRVITVVADEYVADVGTIFYNENIRDLRLGDGITPGGIPIGGGGGYILPTASTTVKGGVKVDGTTISINSQTISVVNGVYTTGSYNNPSWITGLAYSKIAGAPTALSSFTNDVGYASSDDIKLTGGTANQVLVKQTGTDYDYQWEDLIIDPSYTKLIDDTVSGIMYLGEAVPNSLESAPAWRIKKIIFDAAGNVDAVRFAAGGAFTQIWNNRASLVYV